MKTQNSKKRVVTKKLKRLPDELREVEVTYSQGRVIVTSMSPKLTDKDIKEYFKVGKVFNIGKNGIDFLDKVKKVKILK